MWLAAGLVVLAAIGIGIYYLVTSFGSDGTAASGGGGDVVGLYPVHVGDTWGYIDNTGKMIIQPQFAAADFFSEGLAAVMPVNPVVQASDQATTSEAADPERAADQATAGARALWGFIDRTGKLVIQPRFNEASPFSDGLAMVWASDFHGFIDTSGKKVIDLQGYVEAHDFSEGLAVVGQLSGDQGYYGYIDKSGALVIPNQFYDAADFSEGLAPVSQEGKYGYIDKTGYWVIQPSYEHAGSFSEGLACVQIETADGLLYGYIDKTGKVVIQPRFQSAEEFHEGLAVADDGSGSSQLETLGYIDKSGAMVIGMRFNAAMKFSGGLAAVYSPDAGWGYIDKTGAFVIQPKYFGGRAGLDSFTPGGLVWVSLDNSGMLDGFGGQPEPPWGYIDETGKMVWQSK